MLLLSFFFNDPATTAIYTLSLHDALPICMAHDGCDQHASDCACHSAHSHHRAYSLGRKGIGGQGKQIGGESLVGMGDRKSTRLNSSHVEISYAVFCLKKKKKKQKDYNKHI